MNSRRDFLKKATVLATGSGLMGAFPASIQKAFAINPTNGSTFWDAEHVVILMQENRSFDHCFGTLQGVRGFNDPRAIRQANGNKVWFQTDEKGATFAPFRLDMFHSNATWLHSLPHSWDDQVAARNNGWHDQWLAYKKTGLADYKDVPLTLGFYNRADIPFYYALADAFTVCDQHFCSSLTGTTPNRLYLWSGTIREKPDFESKANVKNEDIDYEKWAKWKSFPERLEESGISWKIYQNEISVPTGLNGEEDAFLANFTDNPIEWFENYKVKFYPPYRDFLKQQKEVLPLEIEDLEKQLIGNSGENAAKTQRELNRKKAFFEVVKKDLETYTSEAFNELSDFQKNIHHNAFTTNRKNNDYRKLTPFEFEENGVKRSFVLPKEDVFYQFRKDVATGKLPTVSWLVAPEKFSDHPDAPWFGAWYVSETLDILTQNPEVWKKTIFILTYDENDGQFDHIPPFVAPNHRKPDTGKVSKGIDVAVEQVNIQHELKRPYYKEPEKQAHDGPPIGLGYRVPMVIASPWSRGGNVCSEVFDHTSVLQFLEVFLTQKTQKEIKETNISEWRRTVCGNLMAVFKPYKGEQITLPHFVEKEPFIQQIYNAQFQAKPANYKQFTANELEVLNTANQHWGVSQEKGIRQLCASAYELYVESIIEENQIELSFKAGNQVFGEKSNGCPFIAYTGKPYQNEWKGSRNYAVKAGDTISDSWDLNRFENKQYLLKVYGPNGFYRVFGGSSQSSFWETALFYKMKKNKLTGAIILEFKNNATYPVRFTVEDKSYKTKGFVLEILPKSSKKIEVNLQKNYHWYDFEIRLLDDPTFVRHYAGHVETGEISFTDPAMGGMI